MSLCVAPFLTSFEFSDKVHILWYAASMLRLIGIRLFEDNPIPPSLEAGRRLCELEAPDPIEEEEGLY
jgi:hypothetical protein